MTKFEFRVLCASDGSCKEVMTTMDKNFRHVKPTRSSPTSDHTAIGDYDDIDLATDAARELLQQYDGKIRKVTVVKK